MTLMERKEPLALGSSSSSEPLCGESAARLIDPIPGHPDSDSPGAYWRILGMV